MAGDAAGMITPLCGNGMAMAIHSAKILTDLIIEHGNAKSFSHETLETGIFKCLAENFFEPTLDRPSNSKQIIWYRVGFKPWS